MQKIFSGSLAYKLDQFIDVHFSINIGNKDDLQNFSAQILSIRTGRKLTVSHKAR